MESFAIMSRSESVETWTVQQVGTWLEEKGFGVWKEKFEEEEVDGACLLDLTAEELEASIGVKKLGARKTILKYPES